MPTGAWSGIFFLQKKFHDPGSPVCVLANTAPPFKSPARAKQLARSSAQTSLRFVCADGGLVRNIFSAEKISRPWLARLRARKHGSAFQVSRASQAVGSLVGSNFTSFRLCRRGDLNSQALRHTLLKRVCLPISSRRQ